MKKIFALVATLLLGAALAACGGTGRAEQPHTHNNEPQVNTRPTAGNHSFNFGGVSITMGAEPGPIVAALGEPLNESREPNCAIEGEDVALAYPGIIVTLTYPADGGAPFITGVRLLDDSVSTPEGLYIGADPAEIARLYGQADREENGFYYFNKGRSTLEIAVRNGVVSQIIYQYLFME